MTLHDRLSKTVGSPWFWFPVILGLFAWPIVRSVRIQLAESPPILGTLPEFAPLPDQHGEPFGPDQLKGRVWMFQLFSTDCAEPCQEAIARMHEVQHRTRNLGRSLHRVAFSTRPDVDTADTLHTYSLRVRASQLMWSFISGVPDGFEDAIFAANKNISKLDLRSAHYFVLVDTKFRIRAFYDVTDESAIDDVIYDAGMLINRPD